MAREHRGKLALDSLIIMPVQRIPRYELLIQVLLLLPPQPPFSFFFSLRICIIFLFVSFAFRDSSNTRTQIIRTMLS